jgi:hypothetical protein
MLTAVFRLLDDEAVAAGAAQALDDPALMQRIDAARALHEESRGEYVAGAVRRFAALAADADWTSLKGGLERAPDPTAAALSVMLDWSVRRDLGATDAAPPDAAAERTTLMLHRKRSGAAD